MRINIFGEKNRDAIFNVPEKIYDDKNGNSLFSKNFITPNTRWQRLNCDNDA